MMPKMMLEMVQMPPIAPPIVRIGACTTPHQQTKLKAVVLAKTTALLFVCIPFVIAVDFCFTFGTFFLFLHACNRNRLAHHTAHYCITARR